MARRLDRSWAYKKKLPTHHSASPMAAGSATGVSHAARRISRWVAAQGRAFASGLVVSLGNTARAKQVVFHEGTWQAERGTRNGQCSYTEA